MLVKLFYKLTLSLKLVLVKLLFFLVKTNLELVLDNFSLISHYKIDFHEIYKQLCRVSIRVKLILEDKAVLFF